LVRQNVDVIVTYGKAVPLLKQATTTIPIVFALSLDPVRDALVQSLAHPGGNVTGMSVQSLDLVGKRLELLRGVIPQLRRLTIMADADYPESVLEVGEMQAIARTLSLEITPLEIRRTEDIAPAFETLKSQTDALYVVSDALIAASRTRIITFALSARLPTIFSYRDYVKEWRSYVVRPRLHRFIPARRRHSGQDSAWDKTRRRPGRATDQVRVCSKSHDGKGTRTDDPGIIFVACR
jgi:putative ABC transport system substrate-binding protein